MEWGKEERERARREECEKVCGVRGVKGLEEKRGIEGVKEEG